MVYSLRQRRRAVELMDESGVNEQSLRTSLGFIRRVNRWLGYSRSTLGHLDKFSRSWRPGETIVIADFATGSGDIPRDILDWAAARHFHVRIIGFDLHATTARLARELARSRQAIVRADARRTPLADGGVDYAMCTMFLHHLSDDDAVAVLREMNRVARRGIILADLLRHYRAVGWARLLTLAAGPMVKHDAVVSVEQSFTRPEILKLAEKAGLDYVEYHRHFAHRFVLCGEKGSRAVLAGRWG